MNARLLNEIADEVLYEGYEVFEHPASSKIISGEHRVCGWIYPHSHSVARNDSEPCLMQIECLSKKLGRRATLKVSVRFLHLIGHGLGNTNSKEKGDVQFFPNLSTNDPMPKNTHEAVEREIKLPPMCITSGACMRIPFEFSASSEFTTAQGGIQDDATVTVCRQDAISGAVEVDARLVRDSLYKITLRISNDTPMSDDELQNADAVLMRTFASTHAILHSPDCEFISLAEPPPEFSFAAAMCKNIGVWLVLVGDAISERDTMLASPIYLSDFPKAAPGHATLPDGSEIEEKIALGLLVEKETTKPLQEAKT